MFRFYEKRARRIIPALTFVVATTLALSWIILLPSELKDLGQSIIATSLFLSNVYFTIKLDYFSPASEFAPLLHTWSLAVEEQFYLFFPPLLMFLFSVFRFQSVLFVILCLSAISLAAAIFALPFKPDFVFYLIFFRAWEMGVGAILALWKIPKSYSRASIEIIGIAGVLLIFAPVTYYDATTPFPGLTAIPPVMGAAILIYVGASRPENTVSKILSLSGFVNIGLISYSLYLWHWPIMALMRVFRGDVYLPLHWSIFSIAMSFTIAWFSYKFVEQPFRSAPPKGVSQKNIFSLSAASLLAMISIGIALHMTNGLPNRLEANVREIINATNDKNPDRASCFSRMPAEGLCPLGASVLEGEAVDFLLWGDSHAEAMRDGVNLSAHKAGESGLFVGTDGCPPIRHITRETENRTCTKINEAAWSFLRNREDISTVILAARWTLSVEGTRYRAESGPPVKLSWPGDMKADLEQAGNPYIFEVGLRETVKEILATGRRIVIVGPVPEVGFDVPTVLARSEMFVGWLDIPELTEADLNLRARKTEEILHRISSDFDAVEYVNISDAFCENGFCSISSDDGVPLYLDDDHISRKASISVLSESLSKIWKH